MSEHKQYHKATINKALHEQVWIKQFGRTFQHKCYIKWCQNKIDVFSFEAGHDIPESKGGPTTLDNLYPICSRCNKSMGNHYSITEWNKLGKKTHANKTAWYCCY